MSKCPDCGKVMADMHTCSPQVRDECDLDALMAAIERIRLGHHPVSATFMRTIADAIAALRARAERYDWLRLHSWVEPGQSPAIYFGAGCSQTKPEALDAAIDRARSQGEGTT